MVSGTISLLCSGFFSPFLHSTGSLSVSREYLALPDGPGRFTQDSSCPALLRIPLCFDLAFVYGTITLYGRIFPDTFHFTISYNVVVLQPQLLPCDSTGLGCSPFARHYLGNHYLFSSPAGTKMFQFPALASHLAGMTVLQTCWVVPFGNLRIKGYLHLPRSLSQLITSFIASESQGIRHAPLLTFSYQRCYQYNCRIKSCVRIDIYFQLALYFKMLLYCFVVHYVKDRCQCLCLKGLSDIDVENNGFEPLTPCVQGRCSSQLS